MAEYIERETYRKRLANLEGWCQDLRKPGLKQALEMFDEIPAVDAVPVVHGRWIPSESDFDDDDTLFDVEEWCDWQCSACRGVICYDDPMPPRLLLKYCPNCGAKMDGGDNRV